MTSLLSRNKQCRRCQRPGFDSGVGKTPWKRAWQSTPVFLPGESHGQRSLVGYSPKVIKSQTRLRDEHWAVCRTLPLERLWLILTVMEGLYGCKWNKRCFWLYGEEQQGGICRSTHNRASFSCSSSYLGSFSWKDDVLKPRSHFYISFYFHYPMR